MKIVLGRDAEIAAWAAKQIGQPMGTLSRGFLPPYVAVGFLDRHDELVGAAVFNQFTGRDIEASIVGGACLMRSLLWWMFNYVFSELGCARVSLMIRASRPSHEDMARRVGFTREGIARRRFGDDDDGILMGMLRGECRWLKDGKS